MENLITTIASLLFGTKASFNTKPLTYHSCALGSTIRFYQAPFVHQSYNDKGDEFFTGQSVEGPVTYGFVSCRLMKPVSDLVIAEQQLFLFMESLHEHFAIKCTTGLDHGLSYPGDADAIGMTEYWQDSKGKDWKVCGWTDGALMTVVYVRDISITDFRRQDEFLNSFRFAPARKLV
jgi:hypothetical protein